MSDATDALLETFGLLGPKLGVSKVVVVTDRPEVAQEAVKRSSVPVIVATSNAALAEETAGAPPRVVRLSNPLGGGVGLLAQVKEILLGAYLDGSISHKDRVLCLATGGDAMDLLAVFDVPRDLELGHLREEVGGRVPMAVVERVLRLASELSREGREGKPVGTLFVVGDAEHVLARSQQAVLNPFAGHPPEARDVLDDRAWETVKEFALLDGAFVLDERGIVLASGRYMKMEDTDDLQAGLGGRHLAAASITRATRAIAVAVSSNGAVRVFKDGRVVMMVGKL